MKSIILIITILCFSAQASFTQIKNAKTDSIKIYGNCGMCKKTIEKAGTKNKLYSTDWNEETKFAIITYDSKKSQLDDVLKSIALSGYDNSTYLAPEEAYNNLHECCKYERDQKTLAKGTAVSASDVQVPVQNHSGHTQDKIANEIQPGGELKGVFENYFGLKDALVKTDGMSAAAKASALLIALEEVKMEKLNTQEHQAWMTLEKKLKNSAQLIKENKEPEKQREYFISLSKDMYELIKVSKPSGTVYYQFCPMANSGKGANWLSKESVIKNPYYGSQMLSCGETVETIKH